MERNFPVTLVHKADKRDFKQEDFVYKAHQFPLNYNGVKVKIKDQLRTNMCVGFAISTLKEIHEYLERGVYEEYSYGFIYGIRTNSRMSEGLIITDALKDLRKHGICELKDFNVMGDAEYVHSKLEPLLPRLAPKAIPNAISSWYKIDCRDYDSVKRAIYNDGCVLIAVEVHNNFYKVKNDGIIPKRELIDFYNYGGHCMVVVGWKYINGKLYWKIANSWGEDWADKGYCYLKADDEDIYLMYGVTDMPFKINDDIEVKLTIDSDVAIVVKNGVVVRNKMDAPPLIYNNRMYIPVRFISENMDLDVEYNNLTKTASITNKK